MDQSPADSPIPAPRSTDAEDIAWALKTAQAMWKQGEMGDAQRWLKNAARAASEAGEDDRAIELARAAADFATTAGLPLGASKPPPVAPTSPSSSTLPSHSDTTIPKATPRVHASHPPPAPRPAMRPNPSSLPPRPGVGTPSHVSPSVPPAPPVPSTSSRPERPVELAVADSEATAEYDVAKLVAGQAPSSPGSFPETPRKTPTLGVDELASGAETKGGQKTAAGTRHDAGILQGVRVVLWRAEGELRIARAGSGAMGANAILVALDPGLDLATWLQDKGPEFPGR